MLQMALIDDGVDAGMLLNPARLTGDFVVDGSTGEVRERTGADSFLAFHGTVCARIIERYEEAAEFVSVCIFEQPDLTTDCSRLVAALEWCMEKKIPLIHMSVGTRLLADYDRVRAVVAALLSQGQVIVAAGSNAGDYTMPAGLGGVLGVVADRRLVDGAFSYGAFFKGISVRASSKHLLEKKDKTAEVTVFANSFAAPAVTAAACRVLGHTGGKRPGVLKVFGELFSGQRYSVFRPDFAENVLFLNLAGIPLQKDLFFFSCMEIAMEDLGWSEENGDGIKKCFLFLPGEDDGKNAQVLEYLEKGQNRFYGMLYCGKTPQGFAGKVKDCILWGEQDCGIYRMADGRTGEKPSCPIVLIRTDSSCGAKLAVGLQKKFHRDGYQCMAASTQAYSYLYGFEYLPFDVPRRRFVPYLEELYRPEILILWVHGAEELEFVEEEDKYCVVPEGNWTEGLEDLYEDIVTYFS